MSLPGDEDTPEKLGPTTQMRREGAEAFERARGDAPTDTELPEMNFATLVQSLFHSALIHLGDAPDPAIGTQEVSLPLARQDIDLLTLIEEKTKGNLTGEEEHLLQHALYDLRLRYVEVAKRGG